jgi:hypothetical protein
VTEKMGIVTISYDLLREVAQLPECAEIISVESPFESHVIRVKFRGAGYDAPEGCVITEFTGNASRVSDDSALKINWGLPK